jgi:2-C-methyl-D-erythritol 4-phosphate cytidylyltransferase
MSHFAGSLPEVIAVVPAAGIGSRMQAECPKQYLSIGGMTLIEHSIRALLQSPQISKVVVSLSPHDVQFAQLSIASDPRIQIVIGGRQRADSVMAGLEQAGSHGWVLVHDAARPCLHTAADTGSGQNSNNFWGGTCEVAHSYCFRLFCEVLIPALRFDWSGTRR